MYVTNLWFLWMVISHNIFRLFFMNDGDEADGGAHLDPEGGREVVQGHLQQPRPVDSLLPEDLGVLPDPLQLPDKLHYVLHVPGHQGPELVLLVDLVVVVQGLDGPVVVLDGLDPPVLVGGGREV